MSEGKEGLSSQDTEVRDILVKVSERLDEVVRSFSHFSEKPTFIDPYNPDIRSTSPGYKEDEFKFWGSLENRFPYSHLGSKTAIIKDIKIPDAAQGKGWGSRVVGAWESAMGENGVTYFAATNIKDEAALNFWLSQGYQVPEEDIGKKKIPYTVVKAR